MRRFPAVIISCDEAAFQRLAKTRASILKVPERRHPPRYRRPVRLSRSMDIERFRSEDLSVPIIFDRCPKTRRASFLSPSTPSTRLNASHPSSLAASCTATKRCHAHDVVRALTTARIRPYDEIAARRRPRRVAQRRSRELSSSPESYAAGRKSGDMHEDAKKFFVNYF